MDDQLERVARAMYESHFFVVKDAGLIMWDVTPYATKVSYRRMAQAAIEAMQGWQSIENAPYNTPVLGIILMIPDSDQLKGIRSGWLKLPNALPFVCKRMSEDEEYNEYWCQLDCYGEIIDVDDFAPTHFMPFPSPPKKG